MARVVFHNKVGGSETLEAAAGRPLMEVLTAHGIPVNAVITTLNGKIVPEETTIVGEHDIIELRQVRHYDLDVTRRPATTVYGTPDPIYTKSILFDTQGRLERRVEQFDENSFVRFVEETFVQGVLSHGVLQEGDNVVIGLSGGRDSVAFLKLLERTKHRLPAFTMTSVTITGLPDWEEPATFAAARASAEALGIDQAIVDASDIERVFKLRRPFVSAMNEVVGGDRSHLNMVVGHQVLRRMLEDHAERIGAGTVAFGFNADDLVASMVTWITSGFRMGGIPVRQIGALRYIFPLYRIPKKELTIYLELVAPELNRQGTPGRFTTGPQERSMAYAMADHLYGLWPGIDYYLFESFSTMQRYMFPLVEEKCRVCEGVYVAQEGVRNPVDICDVCDFFARQEFA
ncbi:hypothetical protein [Nonomuraea soli]|uniref:tRNA(Ile)-lysidine synthase TilS/MesJ/sulfur carrier protein ThiS n=1 Tax=Nonomuraea soli TaxID=1032476 RepID=A0A7W0HQ21_9ACTN|nr:hypothetical protein [Nonomuraea soli]MBA2891460.1 tRNA(Ile)-lysidine synthase TilS/MesJ/sulfur carrier protein ThiS [Nonomuraea soli]